MNSPSLRSILVKRRNTDPICSAKTSPPSTRRSEVIPSNEHRYLWLLGRRPTCCSGRCMVPNAQIARHVQLDGQVLRHGPRPLTAASGISQWLIRKQFEHAGRVDRQQDSRMIPGRDVAMPSALVSPVLRRFGRHSSVDPLRTRSSLGILHGTSQSHTLAKRQPRASAGRTCSSAQFRRPCPLPPTK